MQHFLSNLLIATAYAVIPCFFVKYWRQLDNSTKPIMFLYGAFILSCGIGHGLSAFKLPGLYYWHYVTAIVSWTAAIATGYIFPKLLEQLEMLSEILLHAPVGIGVFAECTNTAGDRDLQWLARSNYAIKDLGLDPQNKILSEILPGHRDGLLQDYLNVLDTHIVLDREIEYQDAVSGVTGCFSQVVSTLPSGLLLVCWKDISRVKNLLHQQEILTQQLSEQVIRDPLTQAYNRAYYDQLVQENRQWGGLLYCDLDRFKSVNDTLGHEAGDTLLKQVCDRINGCTQNAPLIRMGGDEFAVLFPASATEKKILNVARLILQEIEKPFYLKNREVHVSASIGVVTEALENLEEMLKAGDITMYYGKKDRLRDRIIIWNQENNLKLKQSEAIELYLKRAVRENFTEFHLVYQPVVDLKSPEKVMGAEALLRWHNQDLGWISPADFIPIAENSGHICKISTWVIEQAIAQLAQWQSKFSRMDIAVNISHWDLERDGFLEYVVDCCLQYQVNPQFLGLEITERVVSSNVSYYLGVLNDLLGLHIKPKIDDFGTGYSGLQALLEVCWNAVKIDRSLIPHSRDDLERMAITRTIISMCRELGITTIAEGIETPEQRDILLELGCEQGQGFLFNQPLETQAFKEYLMGIK
ncbi:MAG: bifunctional diguanylate cyclase/phosphodiesterase [Jaaginema sp. PMC 1079.18]|nr:bifunctional diguanylate cyclase/phosphodiesterase [Jaaginema sp. PMC 1080.18]MEC4852242.1 bifunctional diguanylate cyclase/phosphodiesterase [Jaaginema sp. PMC 1079.18]MEC4866225.1 bifunctional diguanylate cyclase/phosphodiesterase [Jaaginema sp. PMC 1078.18]